MSTTKATMKKQRTFVLREAGLSRLRAMWLFAKRTYPQAVLLIRAGSSERWYSFDEDVPVVMSVAHVQHYRSAWASIPFSITYVEGADAMIALRDALLAQGKAVAILQEPREQEKRLP